LPAWEVLMRIKRAMGSGIRNEGSAKRRTGGQAAGGRLAR
jgi:hypothetical protein